MARPRSRVLTEVEQQLMEIIWSRGRSTVAEVVDTVAQTKPVAFNTVQTTLRILEDKGFLKHTTLGRAFVYEAAVQREQASTSALRHVLGRYFNDSPELLAQTLLKSRGLSKGELTRIEALVAEARKRT